LETDSILIATLIKLVGSRQLAVVREIQKYKGTTVGSWQRNTDMQGNDSWQLAVGSESQDHGAGSGTNSAQHPSGHLAIGEVPLF
jgi:hypothetical protein